MIPPRQTKSYMRESLVTTSDVVPNCTASGGSLNGPIAYVFCRTSEGFAGALLTRHSVTLLPPYGFVFSRYAELVVLSVRAGCTPKTSEPSLLVMPVKSVNVAGLPL